MGLARSTVKRRRGENSCDWLFSNFFHNSFLARRPSQKKYIRKIAIPENFLSNRYCNKAGIRSAGLLVKIQIL